jgi:cytochrome c oxidase subunit 2
MEKFLGLPVDVSLHGPQIDQLIAWVHWLMLALFAGWGLYFIYALIRFRKNNHPKADYVGVKTHLSSYVEVTVAIIELILLAGFSIPIWANVTSAFPTEKDALVVRVVAQQFAWNYHYAGADGIFGKTSVKLIDETTNPLGLDSSDPNAKDDITTINQFIIPVDKPIITKITSKDVIHSFGVPVLRLKQDAIPGMETPIWFKAVKTGQFEVACSQLCGIGHYAMKSQVDIKSQADFDQWLTSKAAEKASEGSGGGDDFWE